MQAVREEIAFMMSRLQFLDYMLTSSERNAEEHEIRQTDGGTFKGLEKHIIRVLQNNPCDLVALSNNMFSLRYGLTRDQFKRRIAVQLHVMVKRGEVKSHGVRGRYTYSA